jgi:hypothetical protein
MAKAGWINKNEAKERHAAKKEARRLKVEKIRLPEFTKPKLMNG